MKLVGGFPHQLFYREFSTVDDYAPLADVARCEVLRSADDRVVRQGFESRVSQDQSPLLLLPTLIITTTTPAVKWLARAICGSSNGGALFIPARTRMPETEQCASKRRSSCRGVSPSPNSHVHVHERQWRRRRTGCCAIGAWMYMDRTSRYPKGSDARHCPRVIDEEKIRSMEMEVLRRERPFALARQAVEQADQVSVSIQHRTHVGLLGLFQL